MTGCSAPTGCTSVRWVSTRTPEGARHALGGRLRRGPDRQPEARPKPDGGRHHHGDRHGAQRGDVARRALGTDHEPEPCRVSPATTADVPEIEVHFVDRPDPRTPLGAKGIGELPIVGVAAAIANAVYHATGKRVRDLPIRLDKLL